MNIGLLLTYNEADVIEETMSSNDGAVDTIFALDGSSDGTDRILRSCPRVELLLRDQDVLLPGDRVRDHHRQLLLDAAHERYGTGHWFTLLHGDEIFHDDPRTAISMAEQAGAARINWAVMQFFLHETDRGVERGRSVQQSVRWYSPFWVETRQFRSGRRTSYRKGEHGRVIPHGVGIRPLPKMPLLKHYPFRSETQALARLSESAKRGFTGSQTSGQVYRERYEPRYRQVRYYDGSFHELELERQGHLLRMWWRWKRWT